MNTWDAEFTVDTAAALKVCAEECGLKTARIKPLGEGWDNIVYLVNNNLVFRFPRRLAGVECMLAELDLAPLVKTSLRTPRFLYASRKSRVTGRPFVGYKMIAGRPAGETDFGAAGKGALVHGDLYSLHAKYPTDGNSPPLSGPLPTGFPCWRTRPIRRKPF